MVVMGDGIHNLTDGLAIGVAFSQSLTGGLSTTIAVFCHELPHELGTALGNQWATHSPWILTVTAGVFLYVALADMMPEMLHGDAGSLNPLKCFLLQSLGLLIVSAIITMHHPFLRTILLLAWEKPKDMKTF